MMQVRLILNRKVLRLAEISAKRLRKGKNLRESFRFPRVLIWGWFLILTCLGRLIPVFEKGEG